MLFRSNNVSLGNAGHLPVLDLRGQQSGSLNNIRQEFADGGGSNELSGIHNTTTSASLSLSVPVFNGFRARTQYQRLGTLAEISELSTRMTVENLMAAIIAEYFNYIQQQRLLDNLKYAVELSKERVRIDEERFLLGSGSKLQLLQAEVFLNADSSRLGRQYEMVRASRIRLAELMALDNLQLSFVPADSLIGLRPIMVYEPLRDASLRDNTALVMAARYTEISEYDQKLISAQSYPYLNFSSGYGITHNTFQSGSLSHQQTLGASYGLTLGINVFDGFNQRRRLGNARIESENRRLIYHEVEKGVEADLLTLYNAYLNNFRLLELEAQNLKVARETLDIAMERYRLGALSGIELREVQKSLLDAEERMLSIQYQTKLAEISLLQISGKIQDYTDLD